jgi:hypothetical protein
MMHAAQLWAYLYDQIRHLTPDTVGQGVLASVIGAAIRTVVGSAGRRLWRAVRRWVRARSGPTAPTDEDDHGDDPTTAMAGGGRPAREALGLRPACCRASLPGDPARVPGHLSAVQAPAVPETPLREVDESARRGRR